VAQLCNELAKVNKARKTKAHCPTKFRSPGAVLLGLR
jgi:hypothetical protein